MSTDTPIDLSSFPETPEAGPYILLERENARLREELAEARSAAEKWMSQCAEWRDANVKLGEDMAVAKREIEQRGELANRHAKAYADAQARALAAEKERDEFVGLNQDQFLQLEYLRPVFEAAHALYTESEEYAFDDGMGRGAQQQFWDALASSFEPATDAIDAAIAGAKDKL